MNTLMKGNSPLGMIYNQSAENIAYDNNNSVKDKIDELKPTKILSGYLPNDTSSTAVGGSLNILEVNEILDGYAVLSISAYAYSQWRTITPSFQLYALVTANNKTTIVGLELYKALANGYNNAECKIVLQKVN